MVEIVKKIHAPAGSSGEGVRVWKELDLIIHSGLVGLFKALKLLIAALHG